MRNVATHLSKEFEKENTVLYSGLKQIPQIVLNSRRADVTMVFARANKLVYSLTSIVTKLCKNTWIILVQKPDASFMQKNDKHLLKCSYLSITERDMKNVKVASGKHKKMCIRDSSGRTVHRGTGRENRPSWVSETSK